MLRRLFYFALMPFVLAVGRRSSRRRRSARAPPRRRRRPGRPTSRSASTGSTRSPRKSAWIRRGSPKRSRCRSIARTRRTRISTCALADISFGRGEPFDTPIGPVKDRGPASGLITRHGYIVAEWGEPKRVDITNSVTKTFLTTVIGLAWQKGLIRDVNDYARDYMPPHVDLFEAPHNQKIKWDRSAAADQRLVRARCGASRTGRIVRSAKPNEWANRQAARAGHALQVQRRARERDGAGGAAGVAAAAARSAARRDHGADRRLVDVAMVRLRELVGRHRRRRRCSRSAAAATGAAACSSTRATWRASATCSCATASGRIARSFRRSGSRWRGRRARRTTTTASRTGILNTGQKPLPSAPETVASASSGNGANIIYIDWENDIVAVVRWIGGGGAERIRRQDSRVAEDHVDGSVRSLKL